MGRKQNLNFKDSFHLPNYPIGKLHPGFVINLNQKYWKICSTEAALWNIPAELGLVKPLEQLADNLNATAEC
jgi:hypothetical protein